MYIYWLRAVTDATTTTTTTMTTTTTTPDATVRSLGRYIANKQLPLKTSTSLRYAAPVGIGVEDTSVEYNGQRGRQAEQAEQEKQRRHGKNTGV